jgi:mannosyltransferase OCH1-like enzyme
MYEAAMSWIHYNPEYEYNYFDDAAMFAYFYSFDCAEFSFSSDELIKAALNVKPGAGKADLFRYLIIYERGGVYMDIDTLCLTPLRTYVDGEDDVVSGIGLRGDLHQWGLIYSPKSPFLKLTIENAISNINNRRFIQGFENSIEGLTGPPCLDFSVKKILNIPERSSFNAGVYEIGDENHTLRIRLLQNDLFDGNVAFKYSNYHADLSVLGLNHWTEDELFND